MSDADYLICIAELRDARETLWDAKEALIQYLSESKQLGVLLLPLEEFLEEGGDGGEHGAV